MRIPKAPRHLLGIFWVSLLLVGCMTQLNLTRGPLSGAETAASPLVKPVLNGQGTWARSADGTTQVGVALQLNGAGAGLPFRIAKTDLNNIQAIQASITAVDIVTPIVPNQGDTVGVVSAVGGTFTSLTFPTVPAGTKRILTIQGRDGTGAPVPGARIRTLFDNVASTGSFGISYRTTPAAEVAAGLTGSAATLASASLLSMVDTLTGATATPGQYTACHPSRINTNLIITNLNASGGNTAAITSGAATYRLPGGKLSFSFALHQTPIATDMPALFATDPATEVLDLATAAPTGAAGTYTSPNGTITATINANKQVTVLVDKVPQGTWKTGAFLPGDNVASPNANYYAFGTRAGQAVGVTVTSDTVAAATTLTPFVGATAAAVEPKFAIGEIRWLKTSVFPGPQVQNLAANLPTALAGMTAGNSTDFRIGVGNSLTPYTMANTNLASGVDVKLGGADGTTEAQRPILQFPIGNTLTLDSANDGLKNLHISGAQVVLNAGGVLQSVTVEGTRISAGAAGAVMALAGMCTIANVHVYNVRHTIASPVSMHKLAGIMLDGSAGGEITNCLVDDNVTGDGNFSVRFDFSGGTGELAGIFAGGTSFTTISGCNVVALGRTVAGVTGMDKATGIAVNSPNSLVQNCQVSNVEANDSVTGFAVTSGTVAGCVVQSMAFPPVGSRRVTGPRIGEASSTNNVTAMNNMLQGLGEITPTAAGTTVYAVQATAPNDLTKSAQVLNNTIQNCGAEIFQGIYLVPAATPTNSVLTIADNTIVTNRSRDAVGSIFLGIGSTASFGADKVTIRHNDIRNNTTYDDAYGIWTNIPVSINPHVIERNRIQGNTFGSGTTLSTVRFKGIYAQGTGTGSYLIKDNLITNNALINNGTANQTLQFYGIQGADGNNTFRNNQVSGNQLNGSSGDTCTFSLIAAGQNCTVHSNRLFDNALGGSVPLAASFTGIGGSQTAGTTTVDANVIAELGLGTGPSRQAIAFSGTGGTVRIRHNSVKVGNNLCDGVAFSGGAINTEIINNAMQSINTAGPGIAFVRGVTGTTSVGGNRAIGWSSLFSTFSDTLSPSSSTTGPSFGGAALLVTVGGHNMGLISPIPGAIGATTIGAEGSYAGTNGIEAAYVF
ncbi:MAG: right-handed parallel beta-helix repeat-containing protein [Candidatus Sericytochromatia bacterium]|nr:right-handed parallel beta-helix repeat-containing protein [Candidatus Sericytochromatia bacterium]